MDQLSLRDSHDREAEFGYILDGLRTPTGGRSSSPLFYWYLVAFGWLVSALENDTDQFASVHGSTRSTRLPVRSEPSSDMTSNCDTVTRRCASECRALSILNVVGARQVQVFANGRLAWSAHIDTSCANERRRGFQTQTPRTVQAVAAVASCSGLVKQGIWG